MSKTSRDAFRPGSRLGPLTTVFTPPATCSTLVGAWQAQTCFSSQVQTQRDDPSCWPPVTVPVPPMTRDGALSGFGYYSPGLYCPQGYISACIGGKAASEDPNSFEFQFPTLAEESIVGCCPTSYICTIDPDGQTCISHITNSKNFPATATCAGSEPQLVPHTTTPRLLLAPLIQLNWQRSDTATESTSNTSLGNAATALSRPSSHTGDIIGATVGGVCGIMVVLAVIYFILKRYRRHSVASAKAAQRNGRSSWSKAESHAGEHPFELPGTADPVELENHVAALRIPMSTRSSER